MNIPPPTQRQARLFWFTFSAMAVGGLVALLVGLVWGMGYVIDKLAPVLLPLAVAGITAYLLDPVVSFFVKRGHSRLRSIIAVYVLLAALVAGLFATVVPRLVVEASEFFKQVPDYGHAVNQRISEWIARSPWVQEMIQRSGENAGGGAVTSWLGNLMPALSLWGMEQLQRLASWAGLILGLLLVPIYVFYFLLERDGIERGWRDYLPITHPKLKKEAVFVISSINDSLIVFFRGQVLVSLCSGTLLTVAFLCLGLNYALFLGVLAGLLGIIPYLGAAISLIPAVAVAALQFQDWLHPLLVLGCFGAVNVLESMVIAPKIIGDRVGLHPLTIMIAMMVGTTLLGGVLGGLLAIPLTAALRSLMFRYVWKERSAPGGALPQASEAKVPAGDP